MPTITNVTGQILYTDEREHVYEQMAGKYLRNAQMSGMDLQGVDFRDCNFAEANFEGSNLSGCKFDKSDLSKANLRNAILDGASLKAVNLEEANLENASMRSVYLEECNLRKCWAPRVDFSSSNLKHANLSEANLENATVTNAFFSYTRMDGTNISGVDFSDNNSLKGNSGAFTVEYWTPQTKTVDLWPPRVFHISSYNPAFDKTTKWPREMRFPKRVPIFKDIAIHGFCIGSSVLIVLFVGALVGIGAARSIYQNINNWGGFLVFAIAAAAIATIAELFRVVQTNRLLNTNPEHYFSSTIYKCEKEFALHSRPDESCETVVSPLDRLRGKNMLHPSRDESWYCVSAPDKRTESYLDFLWSLLKSN